MRPTYMSSYGHLGQFDPSSSPLMMDVMYPSSQDTSAPADEFPMYNDPGLITAENVSAAQAAASVPKPPTSYTFKLPSIYSPPQQAVPSPAPRVNIPLNTVSGLMASSFLGIPTFAWLGIGVVGIMALSSSGGRRRR